MKNFLKGLSGRLERGGKVEKLEDGQTFEVGPDEVVLIGRGPDGGELPDGYRVISISGLENDRSISRFALQISFGSPPGPGSQGTRELIVSRPQNIRLPATVDYPEGELCSGQNGIFYQDTREEPHRIEDEYCAGAGMNIMAILVQTPDRETGFLLDVVGNNAFKLTRVKSKKS